MATQLLCSSLSPPQVLILGMCPIEILHVTFRSESTSQKSQPVTRIYTNYCKMKVIILSYYFCNYCIQPYIYRIWNLGSHTKVNWEFAHFLFSRLPILARMTLSTVSNMVQIYTICVSTHFSSMKNSPVIKFFGSIFSLLGRYYILQKFLQFFPSLNLCLEQCMWLCNPPH